MNILTGVSAKLKNHQFKIFTLLIIFLLGLFLRLYRLDASPYGALVDEMHFGYLAYSLIETGADEHGQFWPLVFKGFGDYKLPMYAYLLIPIVKWLGLSVISIRLPSVFFGSLLALAIYSLARSLRFPVWSSILAAFLTAVSPWPFFLSRFGLESNIGLFFWVVGLTSLIKTRDKQPFWRLILPGFILALTWYSYIAYRPISLVVLMVYLSYQYVFKKINKKTVLVVVISFLLAISPMLLPSISGANTARIGQVGILADQSSTSLIVDEKRTFCDWSLPKLVCYASWNKPVLAFQTVVNRFLMIFSPEYLVVRGEGPEKYSTVEGFGQFAVPLYPFFLLGLFQFIVGKNHRLSNFKIQPKSKFLILFGLLVAVVPNIIASDPQKIRLSAAWPFFVLIIISGLNYAWSLWQQRLSLWQNPGKWLVAVKYLPVLVLITWFTFQTTQYFLDFYFIHTQKNDNLYTSYVRDLMPFLGQYDNTHRLVITPMMSDPVMFYAFYNQIKPKYYQQNVKLGPLESDGWQHAVALGNFQVANAQLPDVACQALLNNQPTLFITDQQYSPKLKPVDQFTSMNGVHTYAYVYDALEFAKNNKLDCGSDVSQH